MAAPRMGSGAGRRIAGTAAAGLCACLLSGVVSAQSPDVGSTRANPEVLGRMFANICLAATSLEQAEGALRGVGMLDNPQTGTFFHQEFDLSVNPGGGQCSMVFVTDRDGDAAIAAFRSGLGVAAQSVQTSFQTNAGEVYVRAGIGVQWR